MHLSVGLCQLALALLSFWPWPRPGRPAAHAGRAAKLSCKLVLVVLPLPLPQSCLSRCTRSLSRPSAACGWVESTLFPGPCGILGQLGSAQLNSCGIHWPPNQIGLAQVILAADEALMLTWRQPVACFPLGLSVACRSCARRPLPCCTGQCRGWWGSLPSDESALGQPDVAA